MMLDQPILDDIIQRIVEVAEPEKIILFGSAARGGSTRTCTASDRHGMRIRAGRQVYDVDKEKLGCDVTSLDLQSGELRLIEVKGLVGPTGSILLTPNERRVAEDRPDCFWLYVVTSCATEPELQEPIKDPARYPWHEFSKVANWYLKVNALLHPIDERTSSATYERHKSRDNGGPNGF